MAVASESLLELTQTQNTVTIIGNVLLALTLFATAWAAYAASVAAKASRDSVEDQRKSSLSRAMQFQRSLAASKSAASAAHRAAGAAEGANKIQIASLRGIERPYLFVKLEDTNTLRNPGGDVPYLTYTLVNYGKTPAVLRSISIGLQYNPAFPLRTTMAIDEQFYEVIEPGKAMPHFRRAPVIGVESGRRFTGSDCTLLILHGLVSYEDQTGAYHIDSFCMRGNPGGSTFRLDGGPKYNWRKTKYPRKARKRK